MPTRLLRESILDSEAVNSLSPQGEVFYRRLMSVVDDYGRFDGRASVLRGRLYPLQLDKVREADVVRWIAECVKAGLIRVYVTDGKQYLAFFKLGAPRTKVSKWPDPPDEEAKAQMQRPAASVPYSGSGAHSGARARSGSDAGADLSTRAQSSSPEDPPDPSPLRAQIANQLSGTEAAGDGHYAGWCERIAIVIGWRTPAQTAAFAEWVHGFASRKVTPTELDAAAEDLAARTEPLKWPNEVLPAINASVARQRAEARKQSARPPTQAPTDEERAKVAAMARDRLRLHRGEAAEG